MWLERVTFAVGLDKWVPLWQKKLCFVCPTAHSQKSLKDRDDMIAGEGGLGPVLHLTKTSCAVSTSVQAEKASGTGARRMPL